MNQQSTQSVYTAPNDTNIGINVSIQYLSKAGQPLISKQHDAFQVLLFNGESMPEQVQTSLNKWLHVLKTGELQRLTQASLSDWQNNRKSFSAADVGSFVERADGFKNCVPSHERHVLKNEPIVDNIEEILRSFSDKLTNNPKSLIDLDTRSSIFNVGSLFCSPTERKNANCEKKIQNFTCSNLKSNDNSPSFINQSLSEISKPLHMPKPISCSFFPNGISFNDNSKARSYGDEAPIATTNSFLKPATYIHNNFNKAHADHFNNENCALKLNKIDFSEQHKTQDTVHPRVTRVESLELPKRHTYGSANTEIQPYGFSAGEGQLGTAHDINRLYRIFNLFERYYLEGVYNRDIIASFTHREQLIFLKIIKVSVKDIPALLGNQEYILAMADKYFNHDAKRKGYKITNNKRFVFRKIRSILYKRIQDARTNTKGSKKARDAKFFLMYFQNAPEYARLSPKERMNLKCLLRTYEESKISVIWKFERFSEDFSRIFFEFPSQMVDGYYTKKLNALRFYLEYLVDKNDEYILEAPVPIKSLPRPLTAIKQYMVDFYNSFGEHLKKSN